jgi:hypothetical protein
MEVGRKVVRGSLSHHIVNVKELEAVGNNEIMMLPAS